MRNSLFKLLLIILVLIAVGCNNKQKINDLNIIEEAYTDDALFLQKYEISYKIFSLIVNNVNLDFSQFPTMNKWNRDECVPILDNEIKRNYRTIITDASKKEPNFAGKYRIIEFGYGSSAQCFFIIDLNNGNVYEGYPSTHGIKYTVDSYMIIINDPEVVLETWDGWAESMPKWVVIEYLLWADYQFKKLLIINP